MTTSTEKAKQVMGSVERFLAQLPGIREYKEREIRREVDRRIRQELMEALEKARTTLSDLQRDVLDAGGLRWMDDIERIQSRLILLTDKVRSAAYGYRPLFDLERVREADLERLIAFDKDILRRVPELDRHLEAARAAATQSSEALGKALQELHAAVTALLDAYSRRERVVHGQEEEAPSP